MSMTGASGNAGARAVFGNAGDLGAGGMIDRASSEDQFRMGQIRTEAAFLLNQAPTTIITSPNDSTDYGAEDTPDEPTFQKYIASVGSMFGGADNDTYCLRLARRLDSHGAPIGNYLLIRDDIVDAPIANISKEGYPFLARQNSDAVLGNDFSSEDIATLAEQIQFIADQGRMALQEQERLKTEHHDKRKHGFAKAVRRLVSAVVIAGALAVGVPKGAEEVKQINRDNIAADAAKQQKQEAERAERARRKELETQAKMKAQEAAREKALEDITSFDASAPKLSADAAIEPGKSELAEPDSLLDGVKVPELQGKLAREGFLENAGVRALDLPKSGTCEQVTLPVDGGVGSPNVAVAHNGSSEDVIKVTLSASGKVLQICGLGQIDNGQVQKGQQASTIYVQLVTPPSAG